MHSSYRLSVFLVQFVLAVHLKYALSAHAFCVFVEHTFLFEAQIALNAPLICLKCSYMLRACLAKRLLHLKISQNLHCLPCILPRRREPKFCLRRHLFQESF